MCYYCSKVSTTGHQHKAMASYMIQVDAFHSTAKSPIHGSGYAERPPLLLVCIIFGLRFRSGLHTNTAVKWIVHSSSESISQQQLPLTRHQAFLYLPLNGAWHCREVYPGRVLQTDRIYRLSMSVSSARGPERPSGMRSEQKEPGTSPFVNQLLVLETMKTLGWPTLSRLIVHFL